MDNYDKLNEEINKNILPSEKNNDNPFLLSVNDQDDSRNLNNGVNNVNDDSFNNKPSDFISLGNKKENIMDRLRKNSFEDKKKLTSFDFILIGIFSITVLGLIGYLILYFITQKIEILYTDSEIEKPLIDENSYEIIRLLNGIEIALISNRNLKTCSAAVVVNSGFRSLPKMKGIPHLTEHMLFLGNEKYQDKSHLIDLISRYFGNINGKTDDFETSFFFDLGKDGFKQGLDSFANMFKKPIVDKATMIEEIKNLQAEYFKNSYDNEYCEKHLIQNIIYSSSLEQGQEILPEGNQDTLNNYDSMRDNVIEYINTYYTGKNMKIAIMSHESISAMRGLAIKHFSSIPKEGIEPTVEEMKHENLQLNTGRIIAFKGRGTISYIDIIFYVKPTNKLDDISFNIGYFKYIQYLLRSTEKGSLFKELNEENKVIQVTTRTSILDNSIMNLSIRIHLLSHTSDQLTKIIYKVYNYIRIIRENEVNMDKFSELEKIFEKEMKFHEQSEADSDFTQSMARKLFRVGKNGLSFFKYDIFMPKYDKDKIKDIFEQLIPENSVIIFSFTDSYGLNSTSANLSLVSDPDKLLKMGQNTHFYSLSYEWSNIKQDQIEILKNMNLYDEKLKIPETPNKFLTKEDKLVEPASSDEANPSILPERLIGDVSNHISLFYKLDRSFKLPKFHLTINLINPFFRAKNDEKYTIYMLYTTYLTHKINLLFCDAISSGSSLKTIRNENGYFIHITSFTDLFETVNELTYKAILNTEKDLSEGNYEFYKELLENELSNYSYEQPFSKAKEYFKMIIKNSLINIYEYEFKDDSKLVNNSIDTIKDQMISILYYGNIQRDKVNEIYSKYLNGTINERSTVIETNYDVANKNDFFPFMINTKELPQYSVVYQRSKTVPETATSNYFYVGNSSTDNDILSDIISLVWEEKFFNELRNGKGIGFHVYSKKEYDSGKIYFNFIVQSENRSNESSMNYELDSVVNGTVRTAIDNLSDDDLYNLKYNILLKKNKKEISLSSKAKKMMNKVIYRLKDEPPVTETVIDKELMNKYTVSRVQDFFYKVFYNNVQKLSIQIYYGNETYNRQPESYSLNQNLTCQPTNDLYFLSSKTDE